MTGPRHAGKDWDDVLDQQNALRSLDSLETGPLQQVEPPTVSQVPTQVASQAPTRVATQTASQVPTQVAATRLNEKAPSGTGSLLDAEYQQVLRRQRIPRSADMGGTGALRRRKVQQPGPAVESTPYAKEDIGTGRIGTGRIGTAAPQRKKPAQGGALRFGMLIVILLLRLGAIGLCALVIALAVPAFGYRTELMGAATTITKALPSALSGLLVFSTPFGGAFRGDVAGAALGLYVVDWLLTHVRARMGQRG